MSDFPEPLEEIVESVEPVEVEEKQDVKKKKERKAKASRITGIRNGAYLYLHDGYYRLVPKELGGKKTEEFEFDDFVNFDKPKWAIK